MVSWKSCAVAALLGVPLVGCGPDEIVIDQTPGKTTVSYDCDNDRSFQAVFEVGKPSVTLLYGGQTLVLPQVPATDGVAYSNGQVSFQAAGQDAFTEGMPGGDYDNCTGSNS